MTKLPNALVIVDPRKEENAIKEARILNIPVFGIVDTNCDPDMVDYVIPGNDDAVRSVKVMLGALTNAIAEVNGNEIIDYITEEEKPKADKAEKTDKVEKKKEVKAIEKDEEEVAVEVNEEEKSEPELGEVIEEIVKEEKDLDSMNLTELKEMAKIKGIKGYSKMKKDELIEVLK